MYFRDILWSIVKSCLFHYFFFWSFIINNNSDSILLFYGMHWTRLEKWNNMNRSWMRSQVALRTLDKEKKTKNLNSSEFFVSICSKNSMAEHISILDWNIHILKLWNKITETEIRFKSLLNWWNQIIVYVGTCLLGKQHQTVTIWVLEILESYS